MRDLGWQKSTSLLAMHERRSHQNRITRKPFPQRLEQYSITMLLYYFRVFFGNINFKADQ